MLLEIPPFRRLAKRVATSLTFLAVGVTSAHAGAGVAEAALRAQRADALPITKFYRSPVPLPPEPPGTLIRSESVDTYDLPAGVRAVRIAYLSRSAEGMPVMARHCMGTWYGGGRPWLRAVAFAGRPAPTNCDQLPPRA